MARSNPSANAQLNEETQMARSILEVAFISAERVEFDDVKLVKLLVGDEPDGERDLGTSVLSMQVAEVARDEVWAACKPLELGQAVQVTAEIERGPKNSGKFIALHIEAAHASRPAQQSAKSADPAKA